MLRPGSLLYYSRGGAGSEEPLLDSTSTGGGLQLYLTQLYSPPGKLRSDRGQAEFLRLRVTFWVSSSVGPQNLQPSLGSVTLGC